MIVHSVRRRATLSALVLLGGFLPAPLLAQPRQLTDLVSFSHGPEESSAAGGFLRLGSRVVFLAGSQAAGFELWSTDGTPAGTQLLRDVLPGPDSGGGFPSIVFGDQLFFAASDHPQRDFQVWLTDGTPAGTRSVVQGLAFGTGSTFLGTSETQGLVYFQAFARGPKLQIWRTDGRPEGTFPLPPEITSFFEARLLSGRAVGGHFVFAAHSEATGWEPWTSDGTLAGTMLLGDLIPGPTGGRPRWLGVLDGELYFVADRTGGGLSLWATDGTAGGTREVTPFAVSGAPGDFAIADGSVVGSRLLFPLRRGTETAGLWATDGTAAGTARWVDFGPELPVPPNELPAYDAPVQRSGRLYFQGRDNRGLEPWSSDGTRAGTRRVADLCAGPCSSAPRQFFVGPANTLYFVASDGVAGFEPWSMDAGDDATARLLADTAGGPSDAALLDWLVAGDRVLFNSLGSSVWSTDGSPAGTRPILNNFRYGGGGASLGDRAVLRLERSVEGGEPWVTDGTSDGTRLLTNLAGPRNLDRNPRELAPLGGDVLFIAGTAEADQLMALDLTSGALRQVQDLAGPGWLRPDSGSYRLTRAGSLAYFLRFNQGGREAQLWQTDGHTSRPVDNFGFADGLLTGPLPVLGDRVFRRTQEGLFALGPDGPPLLVAAVDARDVTENTRYAPFDGALYFVAIEANDNRALWRTDGTPAGTAIVRSFGAAGEPRSDLLVANPQQLFLGVGFSAVNELWMAPRGGALTRVATLPAQRWPREMAATARGAVMLLPHPERILLGGELWFSDGTAAGTAPLRTFPRVRNLVSFGSEVAFLADEGGATSHGEELWLTDGTLAGTRRATDIAPGRAGAAIQNLLRVGNQVYLNASDGPRGGELWSLDLARGATVQVADLFAGTGSSYPRDLVVAGSQLLFTARSRADASRQIWALGLQETPVGPPEPPAGPYLTSPEVPGFRFKVRLTTAQGARLGTSLGCLPETACIAGAVPGRTEVMLRVVGPRPNGFLWPTIVRFTSAQVEVWLEQLSTGTRKYYVLAAPDPESDELTGLFDREGFVP